MKKFKVTLTKDEHEELKQITSQGKHKSQKVINALVLLGCDEGECQQKRSTNEEISRVLKTSLRKIDRVKKRFVMEGLEVALKGRTCPVRKGSRVYTKKVDGDFEAHLIALSCGKPPEGFARWSLRLLADKVVDGVKSGAIKRFIVMAGCDGRHKTRSYFTEVAETLPEDAIILTAGCAKYRYNKLQLGDIGGIPRVLDAGQCNDSYSLVVIALKLQEVFGLDDINKLPISFDIGWYEQKAVAILLSLLYLGIKGMYIGPTPPAFISRNVFSILQEKFDLRLIGDPKKDLETILKK